VVIRRLEESKGFGRTAVVCLVILFTLCSCSGGERDGEERDKNVDLTLIFSSDLRGKIRSCGCSARDMGGLGRRATYTRNVRDGVRNLLVLDAGDVFSLDLSFSQDEASLTFDSFSLTGLDVLTPGEMEFVFGLPFLESLVMNAEFDVVCANLVRTGDGSRVFGRAYTVKELEGGIKVAITGILDDKLLFPSYIDRSGFKVLLAGQVLDQIVPDMKREADLLILLAHIGIEKSRSLAAEIPEFDMIVVGHGQPMIKSLESVGNTLILAAGSIGKNIGRVDLRVTGKGEYSVSRLRVEPLKDDIVIHEGVVDLFREYGIALTEKELKKR